MNAEIAQVIRVGNIQHTLCVAEVMIRQKLLQSSVPLLAVAAALVPAPTTGERRCSVARIYSVGLVAWGGTISGRPWLFKWRQFQAEIIVCAVRWYLRYSLSYREVQELLAERGINVDHSTIWRWVQRYAPELALRQRAHLKPTNKSWRVDETYVGVKGHGVIYTAP